MLCADARAGGADLTGWTLELGVGAFAASTLTTTASITDLSVFGEAGGGVQGAVTSTPCVVGITDALPALTASVSSAELVVRAITVEVVTLAVLAAVDLCGVVSLFAFTCATDTVSVVAADICTVISSAVGIQILSADLIFAALTQAPNTPLVALAGSTLKGPVSLEALLTFGLSRSGTVTITDEVQNNLHLLCEAQRFDLYGLRFCLCWTLL